MKNLLVIGLRGQLARALKECCPDAIFLDRTAIDLSYPEKISEILSKSNPSAIINAAAYTRVDDAEKEEEIATLINAKAQEAIALHCEQHHIPFISLSSDYVFDGSGETPWKEDDKPSPLNAYGRSKLAGEEAITAIGGKFMILRTSWVYDDQGKNFLNTILRLAGEHEELRIINDQYGAPTYAMHLAKGIIATLESAFAKVDFPSGIYHLCNGGVTTWHGFAAKIIEEARQYTDIKTKNIIPITTAEYPLPANRPYNSRLDCSKIKSALGVSMPNWEAGLKECLKVRASSS